MNEQVNPIDRKSPEYWDGHLLKDKCEKIKIVEINETLKMNFKLFKKLIKYTGNAKEMLEMSEGQITGSIAEYGNGNEFDAGQFNPGTFLRLKAETFYVDKEEYYKQYSALGIISDGKAAGYSSSNVIILFDEEHFLPQYIDGPIKRVGSVDHLRDGDNLEILERTTKIEIVTLGGGIKRPVQESVPSFILKPGLGYAIE